MNTDQYSHDFGLHEGTQPEPPIFIAEVVPEQLTPEMLGTPCPRQRVWLPLSLFMATCVSAWYVGNLTFPGHGWKYALAVMTILGCHEMGHFLQARRYGVAASLPYFLPMPFSPFGTFGAVIFMGSRMGNRRTLFDIGVSGPLAGLVPTIFCCVAGILWSKAVLLLPGFDPPSAAFPLETPLLFHLLRSWLLGPLPYGCVIAWHPLAFAGWVGLFITALNLIPIGQLDGGHVLYALLRKKAHFVAVFLLIASVVVAAAHQNLRPWLFMLMLLMVMGPLHPPTAEDDMPLGWGRTVVGWLALGFLVLGFTPTPLM